MEGWTLLLYYISYAVEQTDDNVLWNGREEDGNDK
jgi:hypothetical protein